MTEPSRPVGRSRRATYERWAGMVLVATLCVLLLFDAVPLVRGHGTRWIVARMVTETGMTLFYLFQIHRLTRRASATQAPTRMH